MWIPNGQFVRSALQHLILLAVAFALPGCKSTYKVSRPAAYDSPPDLGSSSSFYVSVPPNGRYGQTEYQGSGIAVAQTVTLAFSRIVPRVEYGTAVESAADGLAHAREAKFTHFIEPSILHWEDRATEWSGKSDLITIKLVVYESATERILDTVTIDGKSKWASFGGDRPQDLLKDPLTKYAAELCGPTDASKR